VSALDPVIGEVICGSFAVLFAAACLHKVRGLPAFTATLRRYRVLPESLISPAALLLVVLEGITAVGLLLDSVREWASVLGAALLALYGGAMGLNLLRGRRHLDCGCFGPGNGGTVSTWLVWRNALMALTLASAAGIRWSSRPMGWLDVGTALAAVFVVALLYVAANGLLAVAARGSSPRG